MISSSWPIVSGECTIGRVGYILNDWNAGFVICVFSEGVDMCRGIADLPLNDLDPEVVQFCSLSFSRTVQGELEIDG